MFELVVAVAVALLIHAIGQPQRGRKSYVLYGKGKTILQILSIQFSSYQNNKLRS
jgi:hypothetical protein